MGDKREPMRSAICDEFLLNTENQAEKRLFTVIANEANILENDSIGDIISHINQSLNSGHRRSEGAVLLCSVLRQSNSEVFQEHADTWARLLLQAIQSYDEYDTQQISCRAMRKLLHESTAFPELGRSLSANVIPNLLTRLLDFPRQWKEMTLRLLITCIIAYPGPCGLVRNKLEQMIVSHLDDCDVAREAYSYLAQCGGSGNKGTKYTAAWTLSYQKLIGSLTQALDELYSIVEVGSDKSNSSALETSLVFPVIPDSEPAKTVQLHNRVKSLCLTMAYMLQGHFPAPLQFPLQSTVNVICRILAVNPDFLLTRPTQGRIRLAGVVPSLHSSAFKTLNAVITLAGTNMISVASTVNQLYTQSMLWIQKIQPKAKFGAASPYSGVQKEVLDSISIWLETLGASSGMEDIAEDVIKAAVKVVTPVQDKTAIASGNKKLAEVSEIFHAKRGKGKKRHGGGQDSGQLSSQKKVDYSADWQVITSAWKLIAQVFREVGVFISHTCYQAVHDVLFSALVMMDKPIPYNHPVVLSTALNALHSCVQTPHHSWPAPVQLALRLFARHQNHHHADVRKQCSQGLLACENIIHARAPSLQMPCSYDELVKLLPGYKAGEGEDEGRQADMYVLPSQISTVRGNQNESSMLKKQQLADEEMRMNGSTGLGTVPNRENAANINRLVAQTSARMSGDQNDDDAQESESENSEEEEEEMEEDEAATNEESSDDTAQPETSQVSSLPSVSPLPGPTKRKQAEDTSPDTAKKSKSEEIAQPSRVKDSEVKISDKAEVDDSTKVAADKSDQGTGTDTEELDLMLETFQDGSPE